MRMARKRKKNETTQYRKPPVLFGGPGRVYPAVNTPICPTPTTSTRSVILVSDGRFKLLGHDPNAYKERRPIEGFAG